MLQMIQVHGSEIILDERRKLNEPARFCHFEFNTSNICPRSVFKVLHLKDLKDSEYLAVTITT